VIDALARIEFGESFQGQRRERLQFLPLGNLGPRGSAVGKRGCAVVPVASQQPLDHQQTPQRLRRDLVVQAAEFVPADQVLVFLELLLEPVRGRPIAGAIRRWPRRIA
jgi:hypothetical protein